MLSKKFLTFFIFALFTYLGASSDACKNMEIFQKSSVKNSSKQIIETQIKRFDPASTQKNLNDLIAYSFQLGNTIKNKFLPLIKLMLVSFGFSILFSVGVAIIVGFSTAAAAKMLK